MQEPQVFQNFEEEKAYARTHRLFFDPWENIFGADQDIIPVLLVMNQLPFAYTHYMSCSGSYRDHGMFSSTLKTLFDINGQEVTRRTDPQGYFTFRLKTSEERAKRLRDILISPFETTIETEMIQLSDSNYKEVIQEDTSVQSMLFRMFIPKKVVEYTDHQKIGDMSYKWNELAARIYPLT